MQVISQNPQMTQSPLIIQQVAVHAPPNNVHQNYHHVLAIGLGMTQLFLGMLCMLFQILAIVFGATEAIICAGIWSGVWFILAGSFGIVSSSQKTTPWIVLTMVMSIISSIFAPFIILFSAIGISYDRFCKYDYNWNCVIDNYRSEQLAINTVLIILAIIELVVSIWASAICCSTCCCGRKSTTDTSSVANPGFQGTVQYVQPIQGQPTIMMNPGQPNLTYTIPQGHNQQIIQPVMIMPSQQTVGPPGYTTVTPVHGNQPYTLGAAENNQVAPQPLQEENNQPF